MPPVFRQSDSARSQTSRKAEVGSADVKSLTSSSRPHVRKERSEAERRELQLWMKQRRAQQMRAYTGQLATLRDKEARPFGSSLHAKTVSRVLPILFIFYVLLSACFRRFASEFDEGAGASAARAKREANRTEDGVQQGVSNRSNLLSCSQLSAQ